MNQTNGTATATTVNGATTPAFTDPISSIDDLRTVLGRPGDGAVRKDIGRLDEHCRAFIARSPFVLVGSSGEQGFCDVSPKGDTPGFVHVLDEHTLVIPERPGNNRADTLGNIISNPQVGLLFIVPGTEHTLRVNGSARLVRDAWLLERFRAQNKLPLLALVVTVRESYFHCAKAFRRSKLWEPELYAGADELETLGCVLRDQLRLPDSGEKVDAYLEEGYRRTLY